MEKSSQNLDQQKAYDQAIREKEDERRKEMDGLKQFYEKKLEEIRSSGSELNQEKAKNWEKERQFFQEQLAFA